MKLIKIKIFAILTVLLSAVLAGADYYRVLGLARNADEK